MHTMEQELPQYFYLLLENPFSSYFQVWTPHYQVIGLENFELLTIRCSQKHLFQFPQGDSTALMKPKKDKY